MIASLEGLVASVSGDSVVLKVGGVGYRVSCGPGTLAGLTVGRTTELHIHHLVREDLQALYGFRTTEELGFFELLITVSGVGPKVGLAIISSRPVADLQLAILQGDEAVLTAVSGVGKRLAGSHRAGAPGEGRRGWGARLFGQGRGGRVRVGGGGSPPGPRLYPGRVTRCRPGGRRRPARRGIPRRPGEGGPQRTPPRLTAVSGRGEWLTGSAPAGTMSVGQNIRSICRQT